MSEYGKEKKYSFYWQEQIYQVYEKAFSFEAQELW